MKAHIVLGTQYGDEGKGRTVDYLCSTLKNPLVVRFCGGQQVGHTVIRNGIKHIHSNFGSGSLLGIPTYYSEFTTIYPLTIEREEKILINKGLNPKIILHPLTMLTTPFDVHANRLDNIDLENGTCGLGIGKTMKRNESPFKLYAVDLLNIDLLTQKLIKIQELYYKDVYFDNTCYEDVDNFINYVKKTNWEINDYFKLNEYDNLVFEGSQGILLDMDFGVFPNVTYANTTSKNAHNILDKLNVSERNLYYISRCYTTRHGAGFFIEEEIELVNNDEEININNKFQKEFKISSLRYDLLNQSLQYDLIFSKNKITTSNLVVTCLDQIPNFNLNFDKINYQFDNVLGSYSASSEEMIKIK